MIWLGIDPGLAITGWAILKEREGDTPLLVDYGIIETKECLPTGARLKEIEEDITAIVREFKPSHVVVEMPFFHSQVKAAGGVLQALGVIHLVCYREARLIPIFLHQASWKANLGNGHANKKQVAMILQQIFSLPHLPIDDSLDAIGIAYAGICGVRNNIR
ncbi:MAG: crossover junction endodeoxyribonuclease RuvC [Geminocystis sp.]|nr:crossover junction endodeoxyribonuclease RuvC [Geminocystis sp.]HIK37464.1 crossover junction endodeoxyribonuclease RuvC [Geminocystis sp. M7585_C2015_104]MCS7147040.1 crossover junction endodeoxyribonuclease RuvC [Geminocystis sp.]MCX8079316.1 crossover junction endodeoxyribonuclease RuvC [Geminocystis sp.]MDW8115863.1 crossover junction endodeoxyribonuclease RuvC [Geminocystis sp.]